MMKMSTAIYLLEWKTLVWKKAAHISAKVQHKLLLSMSRNSNGGLDELPRQLTW